QIALALVAGAALAVPWRSLGLGGRLLFAVGVAEFALAGLGALAATRVELRRDGTPVPGASLETELYAQGLAWIRRSTPKDAVVLAGQNAMLVSVFGERRAVFETAQYSSAAHRAEATPGARDEGIARLALWTALREEVFERPSVDALRRVRAAVQGSSE